MVAIAIIVVLRWLNTVLAVCEFMSFAKSWQEKGEGLMRETSTSQFPDGGQSTLVRLS